MPRLLYYILRDCLHQPLLHLLLLFSWQECENIAPSLSGAPGNLWSEVTTDCCFGNWKSQYQPHSHQANILRRQVWNKQTEGKKTSKWSLEWSRFAGVQHLYWFIFITSSNYFTVKNCNARHCWKVSMRVSLSLGGTDRQGESVRLFPRDNFCVELRCARPQPWSFSASLQPSS